MTTEPAKPALAKPEPAPVPPVMAAAEVPASTTPGNDAAPRFPLRRLAIAFAVAALSDFLSLFVEVIPPVQWSLDLATAGGLFLVLGRNWLLLPGLLAEALPVTAIFPTWILVVAAIAAWGHIRR